MEEQLISFETAKLAKEKGLKFPLGISQNMLVYDSEGEEFSGRNISYQSDNYPAPTQSLLQKWLREKYNLFVDVGVIFSGNKIAYYEYIITSPKRNKTILSHIGIDSYVLKFEKDYKTYEEAFEKGLQEALKLIKN